MRSEIKGFVAGVVLTSLSFTMVFTVFAEPIEKAITAVYKNMKIYVDGNIIQPKDTNGNIVEPFIYNGTTYLPLRAVASALGKEVTWDGATNSVYLGKRPDKSNVTITANNNANIINLSMAATDGEWIYYRNYNDNRRLYRMKYDGTNEVVLYDGFVDGNINVFDGYIYFTGNEDRSMETKLYRINKDGTQKTLIYKGGCNNLNVTDDGMFFVDTVDKFKIYKLDKNGENKTKISDVQVGSLNVVGEWMFFVNLEDLKVYKMKIDGTNLQEICDDASDIRVIVEGDWVYYTTIARKLYKIRMDGSQKTKICDNNALFFNVLNGFIYFHDEASKKLYKVNTQGEQLTKLSDIKPAYISVVGEFIHIYNVDDKLGVKEFLVKTDGTGLREIH